MTFKEEFNKPTPQQQAEIDRQYDVARQFIELHPEYKGRAQDADAILTWMEMRDMKMTLEGMEIAYKAVLCGEPEPKVMSPDLFFTKVSPTLHIPKLQQIADNYLDPTPVAQFMGVPNAPIWIPSTGIAGQNTTVTTATTGTVLEMFKTDAYWGPLEDTIEKKPEKPVAAMPNSWYSGDLVTVHSERRIKDVE